MITLLIYDKDKKEQESVVRNAGDLVALMSDDRLVCAGYAEISGVDTHISRDEPYDLSVLEISDDEDIHLSKRVRTGRSDSDIMLLADSSISPMKYLSPDIRACSLLLRPFEEEAMKSVMREFMSAYFSKRDVPDAENSIVIENREGRSVVRFNQIYYIEARNKKVYFRLRDREYSKYDTLDNIRKYLPSTFVQSHRSFIFNSGYLEKIRLSENEVYLQHNIIVPLSRSYKSSVKEYLRGISGGRNTDPE